MNNFKMFKDYNGNGSLSRNQKKWEDMIQI